MELDHFIIMSCPTELCLNLLRESYHARNLNTIMLSIHEFPTCFWRFHACYAGESRLSLNVCSERRTGCATASGAASAASGGAVALGDSMLWQLSCCHKPMGHKPSSKFASDPKSQSWSCGKINPINRHLALAGQHFELLVK